MNKPITKKTEEEIRESLIGKLAVLVAGLDILGLYETEKLIREYLKKREEI